MVSLEDIRPAPENELIYHRITEDSPGIRDLARSIEEHGLLQPMIITKDGFILSGHRRHFACQMIGMEVAHCQIVDVTRDDPEFVTLLCAHNQQRVKTFTEVVHEQIALAIDAPEEVYGALIDQRVIESAVNGDFLSIEGTKVRHAISKAKTPMLKAIQKIVDDQRNYWPLSDRSIHYDMLNDPVLRHASKPDSRYKNDRSSYQDLTDMLTRARLSGAIPFECVADPTRTVKTWQAFTDVGDFVGQQVDMFLRGYWRNLQQGQPNHIEIVGEKNTVEGSISPVAREFCIPYTLGRGYCSLDPRKKMLDRYEAGGKDKLIILLLSDFDPEGDDIPNSFGKSMRDDFDVDEDRLLIKQVCLTHDQVIARNLPQTFDMKTEGARYKGFVRKYPDHPYGHELESIPVAERQSLLREAILEVIDSNAYQAEKMAEMNDATKLHRLRGIVKPMLTNALDEMEATT